MTLYLGIAMIVAVQIRLCSIVMVMACMVMIGCAAATVNARLNEQN